MNPMFLFLALLIGGFTGLRAFTPLAVVCWAAYLNWIPLRETPLWFFSSILVALVVSVIALGELVNDKRPQTGNRTAAGPLICRIVLGGVCGAALCLAAKQNWIAGAGAAGVGGVLGAFGGFYLRRALVKNAGLPDLPIALIEDAVAIGGALCIVLHLA